jgi:integrase
MEELRSLPLVHGKYYFAGPESLRMETVADLWRRKLGRLFKLANVKDGHPHRFRHTFAVELLKKGIPLEEVSVLLGHSSIRITERHYSAWVKSRQEILEEHVRKTWTPPGRLA